MRATAASPRQEPLRLANAYAAGMSASNANAVPPCARKLNPHSTATSTPAPRHRSFGEPLTSTAKAAIAKPPASILGHTKTLLTKTTPVVDVARSTTKMRRSP